MIMEVNLHLDNQGELSPNDCLFEQRDVLRESQKVFSGFVCAAVSAVF